MLRRFALVTLAAVAIVVAAGDAVAAKPSVQLAEIPPTKHGAPAGASLEDIEEWIARAAYVRRWAPVQRGPGRMTLRLEVRAHSATVDLTFDASTFAIAYRSSTNLNYSEKGKTRWINKRPIETPGPRIHPNYNRWVRELADEILLYMMNPPRRRETAPSPSTPVSDTGVPSIAEEIQKLDELRQRGVLTDEEFQRGKDRVLRSTE